MDSSGTTTLVLFGYLGLEEIFLEIKRKIDASSEWYETQRLVWKSLCDPPSKKKHKTVDLISKRLNGCKTIVTCVVHGQK